MPKNIFVNISEKRTVLKTPHEIAVFRAADLMICLKSALTLLREGIWLTWKLSLQNVFCPRVMRVFRKLQNYAGWAIFIISANCLKKKPDIRRVNTEQIIRIKVNFLLFQKGNCWKEEICNLTVIFPSVIMEQKLFYAFGKDSSYE